VSQRHHFRLAYGVLALAFWVSLGGFVLLLARPHHSRAVGWSAWKPAHDGLLGAHEIALELARRYRAANGGQLVAVQEHGAQVQGLRLEAIGVRRLNRGGQIDPYIGLYGASNTLIYAFCGLQQSCAMQGESTPDRERALRREALELSLYSFRYLHVDQVVSLVEGRKDGSTSAVFLRRSQLRPELDQPIRYTLPLRAPPSAASPDPREAPVIDALTSRNTFPGHFEPLPDGDAILVLDVADEATE
jgi:hypothetical protein